MRVFFLLSRVLPQEGDLRESRRPDYETLDEGLFYCPGFSPIRGMFQIPGAPTGDSRWGSFLLSRVLPHAGDVPDSRRPDWKTLDEGLFCCPGFSPMPPYRENERVSASHFLSAMHLPKRFFWLSRVFT
jgi:hypothetical protein